MDVPRAQDMAAGCTSDIDTDTTLLLSTRLFAITKLELKWLRQKEFREIMLKKCLISSIIVHHPSKQPLTKTMDDTPNIAARAFDIFSNEIVNEIKLESETYSKENAKLKHVKEFMNKIELCIDRAGESIAWTTFDSANVDECPHCACGQKVANWQLRATSAIPLRKTMRNNGIGMKATSKERYFLFLFA